MNRLGFSDLLELDNLKRLSVAGDPLEEMTRVIDFEAFRPVLDAALVFRVAQRVIGCRRSGASHGCLFQSDLPRS